MTARRGTTNSKRDVPRHEGGNEPFLAIVARIPHGRVATYGQVAALAGRPRNARRVGYALAALTDDRELPWHRVVNARGEISARANPYHETIQRALLEQEGVEFDADGRISLERFRWTDSVAAASRR